MVKKQGKTRVFLARFVAVYLGDGVFPCGGLMLVLLYIYLLCYKCGICPCSVTCSFCFPLCFLFVLFLFGRQGWGWVTDFLTLLTSVVLHHWQKTRSNHWTPQFLKFCCWCSALGPAPSHFHLARIITVTLNPPPLKIVYVYFIMLLILCWNAYFYSVFSNINQICPKNRPLTKMITLHNAQNKAECFRNGLLWKLKTFLQNTQLKKKKKTKKK